MCPVKDDAKLNDDKKNDKDKNQEETKVKEVVEANDGNPPKLELTQKERDKLLLRGYKVGEPLGSGAFGTVHRGTCGEDTSCAVKIITPKDDPKEIKFIANEMYVLTKIKHVHVTQVYALFITGKNQLLIFMELAEGGDLEDYIWRKGDKPEEKRPLSEYESRLFYRQFGDAFQYMHSKGIAHFDIKSANILLDGEKKQCKVSDFGLAKIGFSRQSGQGKLAKCYRGTAHYVAPEMTAWWLNGSKFSPFKADVWSTGVLLYEMLHRAMPFAYKRLDPVTGEKVSDYEFLYDTQVNMKYTVNESLSGPARAIIRAHLEPNAEVRPSFAQILQLDPWLKIKDEDQ